jgi:DNA-binding beta-propeller fold protein YncE
MVESPDGRYLIVSNNGYSKPTLSVVDVGRMYVKSRLPLDNAWLGLAWHPDGKRLFASGAAESSVRELRWSASGVLTAGPNIVLKRPSNESFVGGVAVSPDGSRVFAVHALGEMLSAITLGSEDMAAAATSVDLPAEGYTALVSRMERPYVSLWGGAKVLLFDPVTLAA